MTDGSGAKDLVLVNQVKGVTRASVFALILAVVFGSAGGVITGFFAGRASAPVNESGALPDGAVRAPLDSYADLIEEILPAVVTIESRRSLFGRPSGSIGTGFFYRQDGHVLTNSHVLPRGSESQVDVALSDGRRLNATIVGRDIWGDVAVLKVDGGPFPVVEIGDSQSLRLGEIVLAIGSPLNLRNSVSMGIVSGVDRTFPHSVNTANGSLNIPLRGMIQTDAAVNRGNSGGPLVTQDGRVVGITTAARGDASNLGFALAISGVMQRLLELESTGTVAWGFLGVSYQVIDPELERFEGSPFPYAAVIGRVFSDSTAHDAGLLARDVILAINDQMLTKTFSLADGVDAVAVGDVVRFRVQRQGATLDLFAALRARPAVVDSAAV